MMKIKAGNIHWNISGSFVFASCLSLEMDSKLSSRAIALEQVKRLYGHSIVEESRKGDCDI
jgi:hypothetical protein